MEDKVASASLELAAVGACQPLVVLWIPSAFNIRLAWIWMGYAGVLTTAIGLMGTLAPGRLV